MPVEGKWKDACAAVGELVLLYSALDYQLNRLIVEIMHLEPAPLLQAVIATLDPRQKIEMVKSRAEHIRQTNWKQSLRRHADRLERIAKIRNTVCHTPIISTKTSDGEFQFSTGAVSKLMKGMTVKSKDEYMVERLTLERVREAIALAESALGTGEVLIDNFAQLRSVVVAKE